MQPDSLLPFRSTPSGSPLLVWALFDTGDDGFQLVQLPRPVLGTPLDAASIIGMGYWLINRASIFGISYVGQLTVTVNDVVAASLQFCRDRRLATTGDTINQVVPLAHG